MPRTEDTVFAFLVGEDAECQLPVQNLRTSFAENGGACGSQRVFHDSLANQRLQNRSTFYASFNLSSYKIDNFRNAIDNYFVYGDTVVSFPFFFFEFDLIIAVASP